MDLEQQKTVAARAAAALVEDGMLVGLGSGTTAEIAIRILGERVDAGLRFSGVPTSERSAQLASSLGIPLVSLDGHEVLDLAIDGADEVDPQLNCIKGHGGQLLREKIVANAADRFVVVVDSSKRVERLGDRAALPVEVIPFGWTTTQRRLGSLGFHSSIRGGTAPYITAGHNYILDCVPDGGMDLADPATSGAIKGRIGVVEHGLFLATASMAIVGLPDGTTATLERSSS